MRVLGDGALLARSRHRGRCVLQQGAQHATSPPPHLAGPGRTVALGSGAPRVALSRHGASRGACLQGARGLPVNRRGPSRPPTSAAAGERGAVATALSPTHVGWSLRPSAADVPRAAAQAEAAVAPSAQVMRAAARRGRPSGAGGLRCTERRRHCGVGGVRPAPSGCGGLPRGRRDGSGAPRRPRVDFGLSCGFRPRRGRGVGAWGWQGGGCGVAAGRAGAALQRDRRRADGNPQEGGRWLAPPRRIWPVRRRRHPLLGGGPRLGCGAVRLPVAHAGRGARAVGTRAPCWARPARALGILGALGFAHARVRRMAVPAPGTARHCPLLSEQSLDHRGKVHSAMLDACVYLTRTGRVLQLPANALTRVIRGPQGPSCRPARYLPQRGDSGPGLRGAWTHANPRSRPLVIIRP